jgi:hypothetical protein
MTNALNAVAIEQSIIGFHTDDEGHWVAQLACGHNQHVRHDPPWMHRVWVTTGRGRQSMVGYPLDCKKCVENAPRDDPNQSNQGSGDP